MGAIDAGRADRWPTVTVVFLAYNRRDELRISLEKTLGELDYESDLLDVIVVDNASTDGTTDMLVAEFPGVQVITRTENCGVSGWNDGFAVARGDYVLALDDDCYLPSEGLRTAVGEARRLGAHLVSFGIKSSVEETHRFDLDEYLTGLLNFWGCAVLVRRDALSALKGFDPEIFIWAHELEFMVRFFDRGYRHLHIPEVVAVHMKKPGDWRGGPIPERPYRLNYRHWGYIAAKLFRPRDAGEAVIALMVRNVRDAIRMDRMALKGTTDVVRGFAHGLRFRKPVRASVSRTYRRDYETFSSPWSTARRPTRLLRDAIRPSQKGTGDLGRRDQWMADRARFYPTEQGVLEL